jgi:hypothetical protein
VRSVGASRRKVESHCRGSEGGCNEKDYRAYKIPPAEMNKCAKPVIVDTNYTEITRAELADNVVKAKEREAAHGQVGLGNTRFGLSKSLQEALDVLDKFLPLKDGQTYI